LLNGERGGRAVVCDLDKTLADNTWRREKARKLLLTDWLMAYFSPETIMTDRPIPDAAEALRMMVEDGHYVVYLTNRPEGCRKETVAWLKRYGYPEGTLLMHPNHLRFDADFKPRMVRRLRNGGFDIVMVYEDEERFVKAHRDAGVPVFHVRDMYADWARVLAGLKKREMRDGSLNHHSNLYLANITTINNGINMKKDWFAAPKRWWAAIEPVFKPGRVAKRVCDNCRHFKPKGRECTELGLWDVPSDKAETCFFYEQKPSVARRKTGRPKPPADYWYSNEARHVCGLAEKRSYKDPSYARMIVGKIWWKGMNEDRVAEKIALWGTDEEIEAARNMGWDVPHMEERQRKEEKDRIRSEIDKSLSRLENDSNVSDFVRAARTAYRKVDWDG